MRHDALPCRNLSLGKRPPSNWESAVHFVLSHPQERCRSLIQADAQEARVQGDARFLVLHLRMLARVLCKWAEQTQANRRLRTGKRHLSPRPHIPRGGRERLARLFFCVRFHRFHIKQPLRLPTLFENRNERSDRVTRTYYLHLA